MPGRLGRLRMADECPCPPSDPRQPSRDEKRGTGEMGSIWRVGKSAQLFEHRRIARMGVRRQFESVGIGRLALRASEAGGGSTVSSRASEWRADDRRNDERNALLVSRRATTTSDQSAMRERTGRKEGRSGGGVRIGRGKLLGSRTGWRVGGYAARTDLPRSLAIACRSIWRTRSAVMPHRAPISASLAWRPSISP